MLGLLLYFGGGLEFQTNNHHQLPVKLEYQNRGLFVESSQDTSWEIHHFIPICIFAEGLLPIEGLWCDCRCLLVRPEDCPLSPGIFRASHKVFQIKLVGYGVSFISLFVTDGGDELGLDKEFGLRGPPTSESREAVACNLETIDCCEGGIYVAMPSGCRAAQGHPLLDKQRGGAV